MREWDADGIVGYVQSLSFCSRRILDDDLDVGEREVRASLDDQDEETFEQSVDVTVVSGVKGADPSSTMPP